MYDPEAIEAMSPGEFVRLTKPLSERDLEDVLLYLKGYCPEGVTQALNMVRGAGGAALLIQAGRASRPAVITDSERDCDAVNPDGSGEHCYRRGVHMWHRDSSGSEWSAAQMAQAAS